MAKKLVVHWIISLESCYKISREIKICGWEFSYTHQTLLHAADDF